MLVKCPTMNQFSLHYKNKRIKNFKKYYDAITIPFNIFSICVVSLSIHQGLFSLPRWSHCPKEQRERSVAEGACLERLIEGNEIQKGNKRKKENKPRWVDNWSIVGRQIGMNTIPYPPSKDLSSLTNTYCVFSIFSLLVYSLLFLFFANYLIRKNSMGYYETSPFAAEWVIMKNFKY